MKRLAPSLLVALVSIASIAGCHSAGPYGYAAQYTNGDGEETAANGAKEYDPVMYGREPEQWRKGTSTLFGVVTGRAPGPGGAASLTMNVRRIEPRNLCTNKNDEDTCRVTVSDRDFGVVHALVMLRPEDDIGEHAVGVGSLVRVIGKFGEDVDSNDGAPILRATFYRHWPRYFYVTKSKADLMRQ